MLCAPHLWCPQPLHRAAALQAVAGLSRAAGRCLESSAPQSQAEPRSQPLLHSLHLRRHSTPTLPPWRVLDPTPAGPSSEGLASGCSSLPPALCAVPFPPSQAHLQSGHWERHHPVGCFVPWHWTLSSSCNGQEVPRGALAAGRQREEGLRRGSSAPSSATEALGSPWARLGAWFVLLGARVRAGPPPPGEGKPGGALGAPTGQAPRLRLARGR